MPTFKQLIKQEKRPLRKYKTRVKDLNKCPQKKGICFKLFIKSPKKPNSAKRKVAKIKLSTKKFVFGYIPGEGNNLQRFSQVLIRGGLIRDLPGVHYTIIRGKLDFHGVYYRRQGRSKYGTKIWWKPKKKDRSNAKLLLKKKNIDFIKRRLSQQKLRFFRKHFFNWIVYNLFLVKEKKKNKYLVLPQSYFKLPSIPKIKDKKTQKLLIKSYFNKRNKAIKKYLLKARRHLLRTDFLLNLRLGQPTPPPVILTPPKEYVPFPPTLPPPPTRRKNNQIRRFSTLLNNNILQKQSFYNVNSNVRKKKYLTKFLLFSKNTLNNGLIKIIIPISVNYVFLQKNYKKKDIILRKKKIKKKIYFLNIKSYKIFFKKGSLTNSFFFDKILRVFLKSGKKAQMENFFLRFTFFIQKHFKISILFFFLLIIKEITTIFELVPMKQAGRILFIPLILSLTRQLTFALKNFKKIIPLRSEQQFFFKLLNEALDILLYQKGLTLAKINKYNELANQSQPNLHYRWKKKHP